MKTYLTFCFRLQSGWSLRGSRTPSLEECKPFESISANEHRQILEVIKKAEASERAEMKRVR